MQAVSHLEQPAWGTLASLLAHACLLLLVLSLPDLRQQLEPADQEVVVTLVPPMQPEPVVAAPAPPVPVPQAVQPRTEVQRPAAPAMIRATRMLSEKTLADARSMEARQSLRQLSRDERIIQLCNIEAMDQIRSWRKGFRPERLVAYAKAEARVSGTSLAADGAAFRSKDKWYDLKFNCQVTPDGARVVAFEFLVGDAIPAADWESLNLPAVH